MEAEDVQQSPVTVTSRVVTISVWLVVLMVVYVASTGPAVWIATRFEWMESIIGPVYLPLRWLNQLDDEGWFAQGLDWWMKWWFELASP